MKTWWLLINFVLILLTGCKNDANDDCYKKDLRSLNFGFETTLADWINSGGGIERKFEKDIQISSDVYYEGKSSVKFTLSPDSYINHGNRAELTFDQQIEVGDETYYEFSFFIPRDYKDPSSFNDWQIFAQWHDQPDTCVGEDWNNFEGRSPPIFILYRYLSRSDQAYLRFLKEPETPFIYGMDTTWDEVLTISLNYNEQDIAISQVNKGEWIQLKFFIKWSTNEDGLIQGWINGKKFTNGIVSGKNMHNKASHYFKFGLYRKKTIPFTNKIYFDDIKIH